VDKEELEKMFTIAKQTDKDIIIELTVPTRDANEFIVVLNKNLDYKLDYYKKNYNDNLELERFTDIKILGIHLVDFDLNILL
jgi:hypothetical protein